MIINGLKRNIKVNLFFFVYLWELCSEVMVAQRVKGLAAD